MNKITRAFFLVMEESGKFGEHLACNNNYHYINQQMVTKIMKESWCRGNNGIAHDDHLNIVMAYVSQATLAIYRQWTADKKRIPLEDIIHIATELVCNGLHAYLTDFRTKADTSR